MTYTNLFKSLAKLGSRVMKSSGFVALAMVATVTVTAMQPAQAQTPDTWKSFAIIGGSTAAGAYVGHKVAGPTGAWVGAGVGAAAGYAIDQRRRQNEYYNQYGYNGGYYPDGSAYPANGGYYGDGGYYGGPYDGGQYPAGYLTNSRYSRR